MNRKATFVLGLLALATMLVPTTAFGNNLLAVTGAAAIEGNFGLEVILGDSATATAAYVQSNHMDNESGIRLSVLFAPNTLDMNPTTNNNTRFIRIFQDFTPGAGIKVIMFLKRSLNDNAWRLACWVRDDLNNFQFGGEGFLHSDAFTGATRIDFEWGAATGPGAGNGFVRAFRTRTEGDTSTFPIFERTNIDNDSQLLNILQMGLVNPSQGHLPGTIGTYYLDSFSLNRL